ncbi:MAG: bifunctional demethylmenaquinone methyltransferase/2-methoxy-6-polyprenyl-1,4-benzoquinol methylase UbiE [Vulcanimicrobiota bacterium]
MKHLKDPSSVKKTFREIVHSYDFLNTVLSLGLHTGWRSEALRSAGIHEGMRVLDLCTGTGDMASGAAGLVKRSVVVTGLDFLESMVQKAAAKYPGELYPQLSFLVGDALNTPFPDRSFDMVTIAFGMRNLVFIETALTEIRRILNDNGRLLILEFTKPPKGLTSQFYGIYRTFVMPAVGDLFSGSHDAYRYLAESIDSFDSAVELKERLSNAGFRIILLRSLTMGVVSVLLAEKSSAG